MPRDIFMNAGLNLSKDMGVGLSNESELNKPKPRGSLIIESPAIDSISDVQQGSFPEGNGQLALVGGINETGNTAGNGSLMVFCGSTRDAGTDNYRSFGMIGGFKENDNDGDRAGYLALGTRQTVPGARDIYERMRITSTGNVGIGTTNPTRKLHVYNEGDSIIKVESNTSTAYTEMVTDLTADTFGSAPNIKSKNESQSVYRYTWNSSPITIGSWYAGIAKDSPVETVTDSIKYRIGTGNTLGSSKLVIDRDGNVGIGTTSPTQSLDVSGNVNAEHYYVNSNVGASGSFTTTDGKTVTVENGIITGIV